MSKRFRMFSTKELITLYHALDRNKEATELRREVGKVLLERKTAMDQRNRLENGPPSMQSAGYRAYWAGASDVEAALCDLEEVANIEE